MSEIPTMDQAYWRQYKDELLEIYFGKARSVKLRRKMDIISRLAISGLPDPEDLPHRVTRRMGSALISKYFFPISHRTLERWPLTWRRVNGKALVETAELFAVAQSKLDAAAPIRGGKEAGL